MRYGKLHALSPPPAAQCALGCPKLHLFSTEPKKETSNGTLTAWDAWEFCKDHSRSVEVFYRNMDGDKILTRVHFQFDPEVNTYSVWVCVCVCVCVCMCVCVCVCVCS